MNNKDVSGVHLSPRRAPKCSLNGRDGSLRPTVDVKHSRLQLLERTVENTIALDTLDDSRHIVPVRFLMRISVSRRLQTKDGSCSVCNPIWPMLLVCVVMTLVLINDMYTYGNMASRARAHAYTLVSLPDNEVAVYPPLRVEVYYEALCPDSRYFVMKQLSPAYEKLHQILNIAFIPYGKATTHEKDGKYTFECQHGQLECKANLVHACVTNVIKDEEKQLSVIHCMIDKNNQPMKAGQKCVEKYSENWENVESCVLSEKGASIMKHMGDMTNSLNPPVSFIPTITIDGSQDDQKHILQDLHKVLCKRYRGPKQPSCK
ncbi:gamma-interferon-inducible lysosomal thiol reductase-like isoform X1 [Panulirus ornatus]|uniref:gamma-interferon-inducible lysosomal thiol reductase-like isoform X1 n=1 Tax=Panulirus ornatus TaxID=150431 RepID=UPI003A87AE6B